MKYIDERNKLFTWFVLSIEKRIYKFEVSLERQLTWFFYETESSFFFSNRNTKLTNEGMINTIHLILMGGWLWVLLLKPML